MFLRVHIPWKQTGSNEIRLKGNFAERYGVNVICNHWGGDPDRDGGRSQFHVREFSLKQINDPSYTHEFVFSLHDFHHTGFYFALEFSGNQTGVELSPTTLNVEYEVRDQPPF